MIKRALAAMVFLCALSGWALAQNAKPGGTPPPSQVPTASESLKVRVELVDVPLTVTDKKNRLVIMLTKDDFNLFEDGRPQTIKYFSRETDLPLRIGILVDTSNSIRERLRFEEQAAVEFLKDNIRRGKDLAFAVGFDVEPQLIQDYTDNIDKLSQAIESLRAGGVTSLYDAIYFSCKEKLYFFPPPEPYLRRVMIVISDGEDNHSEHSREEALAMAQRSEVTIFAISTNRSATEARGDRVLKRLAQETGGRAFFPFEAGDLAADFRVIGSDLRTQFLLSYTSTNTARDGSFRHISVEPLRKDYHVLAKTGYFAPSQ